MFSKKCSNTLNTKDVGQTFEKCIQIQTLWMNRHEKNVSLSVGTEGPKMLPRRLFHSDLATHSDGWCSTVELVKPDAITCDMIHQNHMNISSWSMLQFVVWLLIWWHLWHPASSFFIHKSWNPQAPAAYFVGHPPLRHMPPGRKKGKWAHKFEDRKSICAAIDRSPAYTVHSDCKQDSNSSQYSTALYKKSHHKSPPFSVSDLQIILLTCCQAVVKPQRWAPQVPFWTTSTQRNKYRVKEPSWFMVFYRPCRTISSKIPNFQRRFGNPPFLFTFSSFIPEPSDLFWKKCLQSCHGVICCESRTSTEAFAFGDFFGNILGTRESEIEGPAVQQLSGTWRIGFWSADLHAGRGVKCKSIRVAQVLQV